VKKLLFILLIALTSFIGCDLGLFSSSTLSPPSWIRGTWTDDFAINSWTFSSDNATFSTSAIGISISFDFKEIDAQGAGVVTDTATNTTYTVRLEENGTSSSYEFEKISSTTLSYGVSISGITLGPLTLTKR